MKFPQVCYQFKDLLAFQLPNLSLQRIKTNRAAKWRGVHPTVGPEQISGFLNLVFSTMNWQIDKWPLLAALCRGVVNLCNEGGFLSTHFSVTNWYTPRCPNSAAPNIMLATLLELVDLKTLRTSTANASTDVVWRISCKNPKVIFLTLSTYLL